MSRDDDVVSCCEEGVGGVFLFSVMLRLDQVWRLGAVPRTLALVTCTDPTRVLRILLNRAQGPKSY